MSGISSLEILNPKPEAGDGICPPDKWTNNCNRAIVETLNEDFIAEFEDKIAGSGGPGGRVILCILKPGAPGW